MPVSGTDRVQGSSNQYDAVFTDKKDNAEMDHMDFLNLMITQMQNQDFTNPMDNSQMLTQMVQFSNMQMMQEMATYSKTNYAMSLVGKSVTASRFTMNGQLDTTSGPVQKVSLVDNEYVIYVGGKKYTLDQIMSVDGTGEGSSTIDPEKFPLKVEEVTDKSALIKWKVPTEDEMAAKDLKYSVYYSTEEKFDTVEDVEKGTLVGSKDQKDITELEVTGLDPNQTYYVNVVVTDAAGNKTIYKQATFTTRREA